MRILPRLGAQLTFSCLFATGVWAQQACPQPPAIDRVLGKNIFSDEQEVYLGDAMAENLARDFAPIDDPSLTARLEELGSRLAEHLPPNQLQFRFFLIDLPEVNAFSLPGGRIYVARKIVALTRSDDELAGVIAHEMGHIVTHQHAIRMTRVLKQVLGVTQVGDRADIYDKFQRVLENERRKPLHISAEEDEDQYIADQVALFAMARAGFAPQSYVDLWDRFNATHGNAGSWFTDLLGHTKPEQKRLRELLNGVSMMPADCARISPSSKADFKEWQAEVIASSSAIHVESLPGVLVRQQLALPLRPDVNNLRFSPDGKYVLAQDEGGIHVLSRDPFEVLFFIEAPDADKAQFSPDSRSIVFKSPSMRVERWNIVSRKRISVHEILLRVGCLQSALSPDGQYLACVDKEFTLQLVEVASGKELASKKDFIQIRWLGAWFLLVLELDENVNANLKLANLNFSPEGRYFLAGTTTNAFAYDMKENHEAKLPSSIRNLMHEEFGFVDSHRVLGVNSANPTKSPLLNFPTGQRLGELKLAHGLNVGPTPQGKYVVVGPLKNGKRGFMDPETGQLKGICKEDAGDVYDDTVIYEELDGRILQVEVPSLKILALAQLKQAHLGNSRTIAVSQDLDWLAASTQSRGAVWDISRNVRVQYVRAFTDGWFGEDNSFYADFPEQDKSERSLVQLNSLGGGSTEFSVGKLLANQEGPYLLVRTPSRDNSYQRKDWTYELRDLRSKTTLWTRHFPQEPPLSLAWSSDYTEVLMGWPVSAAAAHEELRSSPDLKSSAEKEDMFYELMDLKADTPRSRFLVKTNRYSFQVKGAKVDGNWATFEVSGDRVLTYSLASGKEQGHVFGHAPAISSAGGLYAVSVGDGEVSVYQLADSHLRRTYRFPTSVAFKKFSADGRRLFVLTRDQTAYVLDLDSAAKPPSVAAKTASQ
jgi:WD40 repeat protein